MAPGELGRDAAWPKARQVRCRVLEAGALYFALVFAAGFALGAIRTLWVVPHVSARWAELMEAPIMLAITILAARWTIIRLGIVPVWFVRLGMGCVALSLMLAAEFGFVLWIRGLWIKEYFATRDPVSAAVYYALLAVFGIMPLLVKP